MVSLDDQTTIIAFGVVLVILLNMVAGISLTDLFSPLLSSITKTLFGIDLYGIDTMIILSAIILFFESKWKILEPIVVGALFLGVIVLLSVYK